MLLLTKLIKQCPVVCCLLDCPKGKIQTVLAEYGKGSPLTRTAWHIDKVLNDKVDDLTGCPKTCSKVSFSCVCETAPHLGKICIHASLWQWFPPPTCLSLPFWPRAILAAILFCVCCPIRGKKSPDWLMCETESHPYKYVFLALWQRYQV